MGVRSEAQTVSEYQPRAQAFAIPPSMSVSSQRDSRPVYWGIQLDQDLLETIVSIYPEWFRDYNLGIMAEQQQSPASSTASSSATDGSVPSPPARVDEASLQQAMDRNKESLKTSPAFHEQRKNLERAKMGDYLKNKIQRRPDRQELIQQHILEDTTVDPSLQDKQRQLKKARLADGLNDRLSHRPGPLELVKGNILQTDATFAQAVKEGQIPFRRTCEGETRKHPVPHHFLIDEDSGDSLVPSPGQDSNDQSQSSCSSRPVAPLTPQQSPLQSFLSTGAAVVTPSTTVFLTGTAVAPVQPQQAGGGKAARKKSKSKAQPKARTIKFHEYKGPPSAQKNQPASSNSSESSYELMLQQQQLFLQWQLEWQQKYPQIILPGLTEASCVGSVAGSGAADESTAASPAPTYGQFAAYRHGDHSRTSTAAVQARRHEGDLKAELKRRNLPVSGSKPQLIERLKPFSDIGSAAPSYRRPEQRLLFFGPACLFRRSNRCVRAVSSVSFAGALV
ncbi:hypothetical protein HPB48_018304 [Haemaphysalis longicornis]|uniref:SAP domain-containing protein n=1 Tax=Haemaphysalis longicornis TaxID=44386 RepID=A0A9J6FG32_HAELO|nr:hypothetical protein HPB48_018304 [Haemaphysalis longicornis]